MAEEEDASLATYEPTEFALNEASNETIKVREIPSESYMYHVYVCTGASMSLGGLARLMTVNYKKLGSSFVYLLLFCVVSCLITRHNHAYILLYM